MKAGVHSMPEACSEASPTVQLVQIEVSPTHPLLLLKRALPWDTLTEVMTRHWRQHGKNVDGGPGLPWDVSLYVPLVVLMLIKAFDSRQMEASLAENVVARVFIGRQHDPQALFDLIGLRAPALAGPVRSIESPSGVRAKQPREAPGG